MTGLVVLVVGLVMLGGTGALIASCLQLRSAVAFVLATYLVSWAWLVTVSLALSPARWLTRGSLLAGLALGLVVAFGAWLAAGHPSPPAIGRCIRSAREACRDPAVLVLAVAVALGAAYVVLLATFTPSNDMDALEYHLARAALWRQQHGLGFIGDVDDARLNLFPPNAEIGQLATMLLSSGDRYAALPQVLAFGTLVIGVGGLARRAGLGSREAVFGALSFATLPVVVVQAPSTMNDLVVASFLTSAAYFALERDRHRASLALLGLAVALAVGTKYTAIVALPVLALVVGVAHPLRRLPLSLGVIGAGCIAGSAWYVVDFVETGRVDPDVPNHPDQGADLSIVPLVVTVLRLVISFVDMSGAPGPYALAYLVAAAVLAVVGLIIVRRSRNVGVSVLVAAGLTLTVLAIPLVWEIAARTLFRFALLLGPREVVTRFAWAANTKAEPLVAWYGALGLFLLVVGSGAVVLLWRRGELSRVAIVLAASPFLLVVSLSLALIYDVTRGRFLIFGVALAAAVWGVTLRFRALALAVAAIGSAGLFLALANYHGKPSGLFTSASIWDMPRWQAQTTRNGLNADVLAYVESKVSEDARLGLSLVGDDWIHPFFGPHLRRHVTIVSSRGGVPPRNAEWLVLGAGAHVRRCPMSWRPEHVNGQGWRVERRIAPDDCFGSAS